MQITFKLFATLTEYLPPEVDGRARVGHQVELDVPEGAAVQEIIDRFSLPKDLVHLVLVNGKYIAPAQRATHALRAGDALALWPPIAGG